MDDNILTILSVLAGGLLTFIAARIYYEKASKDLVKESEDLKRLNIIMLRAMEHAGLAKFAKDEHENITGLSFSIKADAGAFTITSDDVELTVE